MSHYKTLGIEKTATEIEIKKAYRQLALRLHPDRNPNNPQATQQFQKVTEAYSVLSDSTRRQSYDYSLRPKQSYAPSPQYKRMDPFQDILMEFVKDVFSRTVYTHELNEDDMVRGNTVVSVGEKWYQTSLKVPIIGKTMGKIYLFEGSSLGVDFQIKFTFKSKKGWKLDGQDLVKTVSVPWDKFRFSAIHEIDLPNEGAVRIKLHPLKSSDTSPVELPRRGGYYDSRNRGKIILNLKRNWFAITPAIYIQLIKKAVGKVKDLIK